MNRESMDKTIKKLVHLLQQITHDAGYAIISNESDATRRFCIQQYNRICLRLMELDRDLASRFAPLPPDCSPGLVRMAARDMACSLKEHLRDRPRPSFAGCLWEAFCSASGFQLT
jgi:hypothetical protein